MNSPTGSDIHKCKLVMKTSVSLIALRTIRHSDRSDILSAYSRELGPMSFTVPAGAGKESVRRRALLMPMSIVEGVADVVAGRELSRLSQIRPIVMLQGVYGNPAKNAIALMMADLLCASLRQGQPDHAMWDYVCGSMRVLNDLPPSGVANFHLVFIYGIGRMVGIEPDYSTYSTGCCFDMREGRFCRSLPLHGDVLMGNDARMVAILSRMTYRNMHIVKLCRDDRNMILDSMLRYITIHYIPVDRLRSIDVVRELFNS